MSLDLKNLYFINNGGNKMKIKRTLLDDLLIIYASVECDIDNGFCYCCSRKNICNNLEKLIYSLLKFY